MAATEASEVLESTISLQRDVPQLANACCDSCGDSRKQLLLSIMMDNNWVTLCPLCEGDLLQQMLRNYLRRKSRCKKSGFTGELLKEATEAEEPEVLELKMQADGSAAWEKV